MINYLYNEQEKKVTETLNNLAIENQKLLQCDTPTFIYRSRLYGVDVTGNYTRDQLNKVLHPSLLRTVCDILGQPEFNMVIIKTHINHMFGIILNKAKHVSDLKKLLPNAFLTQIQEVDPDIFNIGDPLSDQAIQIIKDKTAKSTAYINELCLTRLLLTK